MIGNLIDYPPLAPSKSASFQTRRQLDYPRKNMEPENDGFIGVKFFPTFFGSQGDSVFTSNPLVTPKRVIFNEKTGEIRSL